MKRRSHLNVMAHLIQLVRPLTGYMLLAILMGLIGHICAAGITVFGGYAVLNLLNLPAPLSLTALFVCMGVFALLRGVLRYAEQACNHFIAFKLLALIRDKVFLALRRLCPARLEGRDKGNLIAILTADIELLEVFYAHTVSPAAIGLLFAILTAVFIGGYHPLLGLLALAAHLTVGLIVPLLTSKYSGDAGTRFRTKSGALSAFVLDSLRGLSETLQYGSGTERLAEMNRRTAALAADESRMKRLTGRNTAVTHAVILVFDLAMLTAAAAFYQGGQIGFDGLLISFVALLSSFGPAVSLSALGSTLQNTMAAGNRVLDLLDESPAVSDVTGQPPTDFEGAEVSQVTFSYGGETILSDVSLAVPRGTVVGITGRSGSGKSTLLKLLMRFWQPDTGEIRLSGRSLETINTADLRDLEGFVTQDTHLFHDSIEENLRIARRDASRAQIEAACRKAAVHDFILSLPQGYETPVGELGDTLSGGERQRLGMARVFLHDPPLMLLDEPTSNLDSLNEAVILKSLHEARDDRTVILVSHRASTIRMADAVCSVENGRMS